MSYSARVFGVTVLLTAAALATAQNRPRAAIQGAKPELLRKMIEGMRTLRYSGSRVMEFRREMDRDTHTELVLKDGPRLRIEFPEGSPQIGQVIIETLKDRFHFFPDQNEVHVMPPRREEALGRLGELVRLGMRIKTEDGERVAGMATTLLTVSDQRGNVLQKLWINPRNGFLAKRELFDQVGTRVGLMEFRDVNFSPTVRPEDFRILRKNVKFLYPKDLLTRIARAGGMEPLALAESPHVRLDSTRMQRIEGEPVMVQLYQSSQGPLTLFQTKAKVEPARFRQMARKQGLRALIWQSGALTLALIGRQGEAELEKLSKSVVTRA